MEAIHVNSVTVNTTASEIHFRLRTLSPVFNEKGERIGDEIIKEVVAIMTPETYGAFRRMIDAAEAASSKQ